VWASGNGDTITGGSGNDTIGFFGNNDLINAGSGNSTIYTGGTGDSVAGGGSALIELGGHPSTFADTSGTYNDTIIGFDQSAGDTIKLSGTGHTVASITHPNNGLDSLITLNDGSTILLKWVSQVENSFFS